MLSFFPPRRAGKLAANLPVMPERIGDMPYAPAVPLSYRVDFRCARRERTRECRIRIRHSQDHFDRTTAERFRAEVAVFGRFVAQPELRAVDRKSGNHAPIGTIQAVDLCRREDRFAKVERLGAVPDRQPRSNDRRNKLAFGFGTMCRSDMGNNRYLVPIFWRCQVTPPSVSLLRIVTAPPPYRMHANVPNAPRLSGPLLIVGATAPTDADLTCVYLCR